MKFRGFATDSMPERKDVTRLIEQRKKEQAEADRQAPVQKAVQSAGSAARP